MRDYLTGHGVEFDDRNIRGSAAARHELLERTGRLVVPQVVAGDRVIVGYDPDALAELVEDRRATTP